MGINPTPIQPKQSESHMAKSKAPKKGEDFRTQAPKYQFSDMILDESLTNTLEDAISVFQYKDKLFRQWRLGTVLKKTENLCLNFYGPPGTGKTMAAHAVAHRLGLSVLQVDYSTIESKYVGETSKNLSRLFQQAEETPTLILFDEADALLSKRVTDMSSATDVSVNQTRSVLLTLLDEFKGCVIFTTNFIRNYDAAFLRRIPYHIQFHLPNEELRCHLLQHYLKHTIPNQLDFPSIAKRFEGISGSDIANATFMAALKTAREQREILAQMDFENALQHILDSKNHHQNITITTREISAEYAEKQLYRQEEQTL